jgi:hypothetical protein
MPHSESADLVEVVLLHMSCRMDVVRSRGVAVWGHDDTDGRRHTRECVYRGLLRLQAQLVGMGGDHCRGICRALRLPVWLRHHEVQLPEEMMTVRAGKHCAYWWSRP